MAAFLAKHGQVPIGKRIDTLLGTVSLIFAVLYIKRALSYNAAKNVSQRHK